MSYNYPYEMRWWYTIGLDGLDEDDALYDEELEEEDEEEHTYSNEEFCYICNGTCQEILGEEDFFDEEDDDDEDDDDLEEDPYF